MTVLFLSDLSLLWAGLGGHLQLCDGFRCAVVFVVLVVGCVCGGGGGEVGMGLFYCWCV